MSEFTIMSSLMKRPTPSAEPVETEEDRVGDNVGDAGSTILSKSDDKSRKDQCPRSPMEFPDESSLPLTESAPREQLDCYSPPDTFHDSEEIYNSTSLPPYLHSCKHPFYVMHYHANPFNSNKSRRTVSNIGKFKSNSEDEDLLNEVDTKWIGFKPNFPTYADEPPYRKSGLLDLATDMDVLLDNNTEENEDLNTDSSPQRPISPIAPEEDSTELYDSQKWREIYKNLCGMKDIKSDIIEEGNQKNIYHSFPCHCPVNCKGKMVKKAKKDKRTWLWKNKEARSAALSIQNENDGARRPFWKPKGNMQCICSE